MKNSSLTKEQKVLLKLTARSLNSSSDFDLTKDELKKIDWAEVKEQSMAQAVALIAYDQALQYRQHIPEQVLEEWNDYAMANYGANFRIMQEQNSVLSLIKDSYKYVVLKGLSASQYYPNPTLRVHGDIDFFIERDKLKELENIFIQDGYAKLQEDHPNHVLLKKGFAQVEMHFEITGIPAGQTGEKVREFLKGVFDNPSLVKHDMCEFKVPSHIHHALILLLHMQHHMLVEGIGIRHLYDWGAFIKATMDQSFGVN